MEYFKMPDGIDCKLIITDEEKLTKDIQQRKLGVIMGDCVATSYTRYKKLYEIGLKIGNTDGIKRCRGYRKFVSGYEPSYHYWIENNGVVYDECLGKLRIFKKREEYYSVFQIKDIGYAEFYCFFNDEEISQSPWIRPVINKKLFAVIDFVIKANE